MGSNNDIQFKKMNGINGEAETRNGMGYKKSHPFQRFENAESHKRISGSSLHYRTAGNGYWVAFLLPLALILGNEEIMQRQVRTAVLIMVLNVALLCFYRRGDLNLYMLLQRIRRANIGLGAFIIGVCVLHGGFVYEVSSYVALHFTFPYLFYNVVKQHPSSFTFGEGVLATSAFAYQFWKTSQNLPFPPSSTPIYLLPERSIIMFFLQLVFFGSILAARVILLLQKPWKLFILEEMLCLWSKYCAMAFLIRVPINNDEVAAFLLMWPFKFLVATKLRVLLMMYWALLSMLAGIFLILKSYTSRKRAPSTIDRKLFHFAIVLVFLPGIFWDINMIFCCSAVLFFIFTLVEAARVLKFEVLGIKVGGMINEHIKNFRDRQDEGRLLLTPIYLLIGCSLPIWLTGLPVSQRDLEPVHYAACLAGVLSIGIGDTFASIGGTYFGRIRWRDSRKTVEGTFCSLISQLLVASLIFMSGVIPYTPVTVGGLVVGIIVNAFVEGNTDQIDNIVLPLITYIVIHAFHLIFSGLEEVKA